MTRLAAALIALTILPADAAPTPALVNADFQHSDAITGMPLGWTAVSGDYDARTVCAATCALQLQSRDGAGQGDGVYQMVDAGAAAGHVLVLSGRVRTDNADGNAFLAVRMMDEHGTLAENADGPPAPNGTSGWRAVTLRVPVPAHATRLAIGMALRGKGSAWFDGLTLEIDQQAQSAMPMRPVPSQQLLDDAALRIPETDIPAIPPGWREDVLARRQPVRSLFSEDYSDLQFLKPLLQGKRVVQLGEAAHGVAESNWAKIRLIKFLHQEMGYDVIAFESSFDQCDDADRDVGVRAPRDVMAQCLFSIWQTSEVAGLFNYLAVARASGRPLALAGVDIQFSAPRKLSTALHTMLATADSALASQLDDHERELAASTILTKQRSAAITSFYEAAAAVLAAQRSTLDAAGYHPADIDAAIETARGRQWLARRNEHLGVPNSISGNAVRDAGMAAHLDFLLDVRYPQRKLIVWAHNLHVTYAHAAGGFASMGELLAQRRRAQMYTIGFYMGRGRVTNGFGAPWTVAAPPAGTVEGVLANGGFNYAYVDFSHAAPAPSNTWFTGANTVREFGTVPRDIVPAQAYDGLFYIHGVTPAQPD